MTPIVRSHSVKILIAVSVISATIGFSALSADAAVKPKAGASCTKLNATTAVSGSSTRLMCTKVKSKKVWVVAKPAAGGTTIPTAATDPVGTWTVGTGSSAGYRVEENFSVGGTKTAVGRTDKVTGTLTLAKGGSGFTAKVAITVDMASVSSPESRRDNQLKTRGIQTSTFPTATFVADAIVIPAGATSGKVDVVAKGKLTLHGVTKDIDVPVSAQLNAGQLQILGKASISNADYGIEAPNIPGFVTVEDKGDIEFLLILTKG